MLRRVRCHLRPEHPGSLQIGRDLRGSTGSASEIPIPRPPAASLVCSCLHWAYIQAAASSAAGADLPGWPPVPSSAEAAGAPPSSIRSECCPRRPDGAGPTRQDCENLALGT